MHLDVTGGVTGIYSNHDPEIIYKQNPSQKRVNTIDILMSHSHPNNDFHLNI